jgi:hypothetical protein
MKNSSNTDISNLFRRFGGDTSAYKEFGQRTITEKSREIWPVIDVMYKNRVAPRKSRLKPASLTTVLLSTVSPIPVLDLDIPVQSASFLTDSSSTKNLLSEINLQIIAELGLDTTKLCQSELLSDVFLRLVDKTAPSISSQIEKSSRFTVGIAENKCL